MMRGTLVLSVFTLAFAGSLFAQSGAGFGSISGVVTDASGAAVPAGKVEIVNASRGVRRTLETNGDGVFTAPALTPSDGYTVSVSKDGFAKYQTSAFAI